MLSYDGAVCIWFGVNLMLQSNGADQFGINNKNLFLEESQSAGPDVPPALPPKTGTPTRPPPPPPGQYLLWKDNWGALQSHFNMY